MDSIWKKTAELPRFASLEGDLKTDVLVIGGGMAGLLCTWQLTQSGAECVLVEAKRICGGTTGNTTAKITSQHGLIYDKLIREFGREKAQLYLESNQAALERYRELCGDIDCGFEEKDAYLYSLDDREALEKELRALEALGFAADLTEGLPLPFPTVGAIRFSRQGQFQPVQFAAAIAKRLRIFEDTKVLELMPGRAVTNRGTILAENMIVATHYPLLNKHGGYFLKLYQDRSYVLALENAPDLNGMYMDACKTGISFRNYKSCLLLGGGSHRTGKQGSGWRELEQIAACCYPNARETAHWAAQDCMSLDGVPYVGLYSRHTPGLYVAAGFNKWGMTASMAAAMLLADLIQGKENPWTELYSPSRQILRPQLAANIWESAVGLLTPTRPRCPHMGCALQYNAAERSWDCPCHGSRFGEDGALIDNPATDDKRGLSPF